MRKQTEPEEAKEPQSEAGKLNLDIDREEGRRLMEEAEKDRKDGDKLAGW